MSIVLASSRLCTFPCGQIGSYGLRSPRRLGLRCRRRLPGIDVKLVVRCAHHAFVKPTQDVFEAFDAMPGFSRARELVRFARKDDHGGWTLQVFEGTEQLLAAGVLRCTVVGFAEHKEHRSADILHESNR